MLLEDSLRVYEHRNMRPYYTQKDLRNLSRHAHTMGYGRPFQFHDGTSVEFLDAGHVIGSAQALVTPPSSTGEKPLLYTGDMKLWPTRMHLGAQIPHEDIGTLVIESTYAIKDHPPREELEGQFALGLREAVEEGCSVLVPTFAVGRAQEVLMAIYENKVHAQIYIDGMAQAVTQLVLDYPSYVRDDRSLRNAVKSAHFVSGMKREKIGANGPAIIVATAGMLEGGPILGYIQRLSRSGKLKVFLTGYQVAGTNGRLLLDKGLIRMNGKMSKINAEVQFFDFSAHSGRKELFSYVEKVNPEKVYTVHGEAESCIGFAKELSEEGFDATSPEVGKSYPA
jgi:putative mRNA 3-end processing factor